MKIKKVTDVQSQVILIILHEYDPTSIACNFFILNIFPSNLTDSESLEHVDFRGIFG